jgi:hypothetical protein
MHGYRRQRQSTTRRRHDGCPSDRQRDGRRRRSYSYRIVSASALAGASLPLSLRPRPNSDPTSIGQSAKRTRRRPSPNILCLHGHAAAKLPSRRLFVVDCKFARQEYRRAESWTLGIGILVIFYFHLNLSYWYRPIFMPSMLQSGKLIMPKKNCVSSRTMI